MIHVPEGGKAICNPPPGDWKEAAGKNSALLKSLKSARLREKWRKKTLELAAAYMESLGLPVPEIQKDAELVIAGHQPLFFHPGIIYKYGLIACTELHGMTPIFISVDSDQCDGFPVRLPAYRQEDNKYSRVIHMMQPSARTDLFRDAVLDIDSLRAFGESAKKEISSLPGNPFKYGHDFLKRELVNSLPEKMRDAMVVLRGRYQPKWAASVLELPLSILCETQEFYEFAFDLISKAGEVRELFNATLADYRKEHHIRSKANPFPNLAGTEDGSSETLLWVVDKSGRQPLFVKRERDGKISIRGNGKSITAASGGELMSLCRENSICLWPRAVALSIMLRLFIADLFVHGIGGEHYDRITDRLIPELYGIKPPLFVTASYTAAAPGMDDPEPLLDALKEKLRNIKYHPESYLDKTPEIEAALAQKQKLVSAIKVPGAAKKSLSIQINEINEKLSDELTGKRAAVQKEIEKGEAELNRYQTVADRELPYFLYPPEIFDAKGILKE